MPAVCARTEMFPTLVRSAVLGAENQAARVGGIAAPFIVLLGQQVRQGAMGKESGSCCLGCVDGAPPGLWQCAERFFESLM